MLRALLAVAALFLSTAALSAQMSLDEQRTSYPLAVCAVSGEAFEAGMTPVEKEHAGTLVRLCCEGCVKGFDKDPDAIVASVQAAVIADQKPRYPLTTCLVTEEELGDDAVDHVFGTRLVRVKDADAAKAFDENWGRLIGDLDAAWIEAGRASYPLTTCIVSEEPLEDPVKEVLYGTRLVRLCCKGCVKEFHANPPRIMAQLDARAKELAAKRERAAPKKSERKAEGEGSRGR